ncbi:MAG: branched-chain amino acid aminotransferase, partial [Opitutae bacterium]|nr:branched-chain amino acid aminotransferase [Opitutae bacterium]
RVDIEIAAEVNAPMKQEILTRSDIWVSDECFLTGTAAEVVPVVEVDGRKIGSGKPGEVTGRFLAAFRSKVAKEGTFL